MIFQVSDDTDFLVDTCQNHGGFQMQQPSKADDSLLESIPTPEQVRKRLVQNSRESRLLRSLYKLSQRVAEQQSQVREAQSK